MTPRFKQAQVSCFSFCCVAEHPLGASHHIHDSFMLLVFVGCRILLKVHFLSFCFPSVHCTSCANGHAAAALTFLMPTANPNISASSLLTNLATLFGLFAEKISAKINEL